MTDTNDIDPSRRGDKQVDNELDPDLLARDGWADPQTGRVKNSVARSERALAATEMKLAGATYQEIYEVLELASPAIARRLVEHTLASNTDETKDYSALRSLTSLRLEGLLKSVWPRATDQNDPEQLSYHRAGLSVIDRFAKLHGLDAPTRVAIFSPSSEQMDKVVTAMLVASGVTDADEADIFAMDDIEDAEWEDADAEG